MREIGYYWAKIELAYGEVLSNWMPFYWDGKVFYRGGIQFQRTQFMDFNDIRIKNPDEA